MAVLKHGNRVRLHAATLALFFAASATPTPLYPLYHQLWGASSLQLSLVFAAYSLALLAALLTCGALSDQIGRRPVILAAVVGELLALLGFVFARDVAWLIAARIVQGFATGLAAASLGAAILDADHQRGPLVNSVVPFFGLGAGALGSSLLVRFAPAPLHLGFLLLCALFVLQGMLTFRLRTASGPVRPFSFRPRIALPRQARPALLTVTPAIIALWTLGGFEFSLLPSLLAAVAPWAGAPMIGIAVAALPATAVPATLCARRHRPALMLPFGASALLAGTSCILAGAHLASLALLAAGSVTAGIGFGAGYYGAVQSVLPLAAPQERAALMSAFYLECYLANALPVIAAGATAKRLGLLATTDLLGAAIILLSALAILAGARGIASPLRRDVVEVTASPGGSGAAGPSRVQG